MSEVTIAGEIFQIAPRYGAGHVLTEPEAAAFNQAFVVRVAQNNLAAVHAAKAAGTFDTAIFQDKITAYANEYEFGRRNRLASPRAKPTRDPVLAEALKISKRKVLAALVAKYGSKHGQTNAYITELAQQHLAGPKGPAIMAAARAELAILADTGDDVLRQFAA